MARRGHNPLLFISTSPTILDGYQWWVRVTPKYYQVPQYRLKNHTQNLTSLWGFSGSKEGGVEEYNSSSSFSVNTKEPKHDGITLFPSCLKLMFIMILRYFRDFLQFEVLSKYGRRFSKFWKKLKWTVEIVQKIIKFDKPGVQYIIGTSLSKCHYPCPSLLLVPESLSLWGVPIQSIFRMGH